MTVRPPIYLLFSIGCLAAGLSGQSLLESYGFGQPQPEADVVGQSMGGISVLPMVRGSSHYSLPASWHLIRRTQFQVGLTHNEVLPDGGGLYRRDVFQQAQFLAHQTNRAAFGVGMRPLTRVDLAMIDTTTGAQALGPDNLTFNQMRKLSGGMSAFRVGYSRRVTGELSLGLSLDFIFGTLNQLDTLIFTDWGSRNDLPLDLISKRRMEFTGKALGLSLLWDRGEDNRGFVGMQMQFPLNLDLITHSQSTGLAGESTIRQSGVGLPFEARIGYGYSLTASQLILAELGFSTLPAAHAHKQVFGRYLKRTGELRLGWSKTPPEGSEFQPGRFYYRVGFSYLAYYLSALNNAPSGVLNEFSLTAGVGFRSLPPRNRLDLAVQYGLRNGPWLELQEKFVRLSMSVTTGELWFMRPKKKWD
ncbi:MAG: hypothetical protein V3W14_08425 [Candidatus Neomarinimicrobiota bacterium]